MKSYKQLFSRFLQSNPNRLHFAAHSHHFWPDCSFDAHAQAWLDAATKVDDKWGTIFSDVLPEAQGHVARQLGLPDPSTIVFAPNTHEFVVRLFSCLPVQGSPSAKPRILCSDGEFHSFHRQRRRWQEAGLAEVEVIAVEPGESVGADVGPDVGPDVGARFLHAARAGQHDMVFLSHVFFNSGYVVDILEELCDLLRERSTLLVIDGYHAFMALPTNLSAIADKAFYIAGGYKYAMAGEGACFMHCPPGIAKSPVNTGWFAGFGALEQSGDVPVAYADDGMRFAGATFDVSGLYRFNAVQRMLAAEGLEIRTIHEHVRSLQSQFLAGLNTRGIELGTLVPGPEQADRGHFLTFVSTRAPELCAELARREVATDVRGDRLRFGFAIYQDPEDVEQLLQRLQGL